MTGCLPGSVALTFFRTCGPQYVGQLSFLDTTYCGQFLRFWTNATEPQVVIFHQYSLFSPGGLVLKRLCSQKYCSGISRTRSSMNSFMRRVSAMSSPVG